MREEIKPRPWRYTARCTVCDPAGIVRPLIGCVDDKGLEGLRAVAQMHADNQGHTVIVAKETWEN
jgi:hypothetical protein